MCLNFKTGSKEPGTPCDYCKAWTASKRVRTQEPGSAILTLDRLPAASPSLTNSSSTGYTSPSGTLVLRHHSHDKVRFGNELILRNALVFTLRFKMVVRAVWYRRGEWCPLTSHPPLHGEHSHTLPPSPTAHCLGSQHRWTKGKERELFQYFPQVKSQNMTITF